MRRAMLAVAIAGLALAGCGGGAPAGPSEDASNCQPHGDRLSLLARQTAFDPECLAVDAGTKFEIQFDNQDGGVRHNVAVLSEDPAQNPSATVLFRGQIIQGPDMIGYGIRALPASRYFFRCDVHPLEMNGVLVVE